LVPEKNVDALAGAIKKLILNASSWPQMARTGRRFVEAKYDMKIIAPQLVAVYKK